MPHGTPHSTLKMLQRLCILLPRIPLMRAIKDTMALVAHSMGVTNPGCICSNILVPLAFNPALLSRQGVSTHAYMDNWPELCHQKRQLIVGLRVDFVRPCKPPQRAPSLLPQDGAPRSEICSLSQTDKSWASPKQGDQKLKTRPPENGDVMAKPTLTFLGPAS